MSARARARDAARVEEEDERAANSAEVEAALVVRPLVRDRCARARAASARALGSGISSELRFGEGRREAKSVAGKSGCFYTSSPLVAVADI